VICTHRPSNVSRQSEGKGIHRLSWGDMPTTQRMHLYLQGKSLRSAQSRVLS
jgi:hypothetical protein